MRSRTALVFSFAVLALSGQAMAGSASIRFLQRYVGQPYSSAREQIIRHGYRPVPLKQDATATECKYSDLCKRYREHMDCASDSACLFVFRAAGSGAYMVVGTFGDARVLVAALEMADAGRVQEIEPRLVKSR